MEGDNPLALQIFIVFLIADQLANGKLNLFLYSLQPRTQQHSIISAIKLPTLSAKSWGKKGDVSSPQPNLDTCMRVPVCMTNKTCSCKHCSIVPLMVENCKGHL